MGVWPNDYNPSLEAPNKLAALDAEWNKIDGRLAAEPMPGERDRIRETLLTAKPESAGKRAKSGFERETIMKSLVHAGYALMIFATAVYLISPMSLSRGDAGAFGLAAILVVGVVLVAIGKAKEK